MKQPIFAILILSTLFLQTHSASYVDVVDGTGKFCTSYLLYTDVAINTVLGGTQDYSTIENKQANCANLIEAVIQAPQTSRTGCSDSSLNACDENLVVAYGEYTFSAKDNVNSCYVCTASQTAVSAAYNLKQAILGPLPDFYVVSDPEQSPKADSLWETQDVECGSDQFVSLNVNTGDFECVGCTNPGQAGFYSEYSVARTSGTGVKHGKCCINGHHKVCQQLLNSYKTKCVDDANDADKGHAANRECSA